MRRTCLGVVLAFGLAACAATAAPDFSHGEKLRLNASDQAFAHGVTLHRSDFVPSAYGSVWRGVHVKPVVSGLSRCPVDADMSKFVITGVARTRWLRGNLELDSQATVFEKPWMLHGEWHLRTQALDCARRAFSRDMTRQGGRLISFRRILLPRIAPYAIGVRMLVDLPSLDNWERWLIETIALGRRRTAIVVTSSGFASDGRLIFDAALGSATRLIKRTRHVTPLSDSRLVTKT
jgi:hypothetical protein